MITLGIDPGIARCGYGVIQTEGQKDYLIAYGCIETEKELTLPQRLVILKKELEVIIKKYKPQKVGVEELFFSKNAKTAFQVGQARGVILLTLEEQGLSPVELKPNEIKLAITGHGAADKKQIQQMVRLILTLDHDPKPDDAADGLAVALTTSRL